MKTKLPPEPKVYTGHCGKEHERLMREGHDYFVFYINGVGHAVAAVDPKIPNQLQNCLDGIDYGAWTRIRAMSADDALAVACEAEDQYEAWANGDPNYLEIVRVPRGDRF